MFEATTFLTVGFGVRLISGSCFGYSQKTCRRPAGISNRNRHTLSNIILKVANTNHCSSSTWDANGQNTTKHCFSWEVLSTHWWAIDGFPQACSPAFCFGCQLRLLQVAWTHHPLLTVFFGAPTVQGDDGNTSHVLKSQDRSGRNHSEWNWFAQITLWKCKVFQYFWRQTNSRLCCSRIKASRLHLNWVAKVDYWPSNFSASILVIPAMLLLQAALRTCQSHPAISVTIWPAAFRALGRLLVDGLQTSWTFLFPGEKNIEDGMKCRWKPTPNCLQQVWWGSIKWSWSFGITTKSKKKRAGRCGSALFHIFPFKFSRFILSNQIICQVFSSFHLLLHKHHTMSDVSAIVLTNMKPH